MMKQVDTNRQTPMGKFMKLSHAACCLTLLAVVFSLSCDKAEINSDKRYTGRVVMMSCPSYAVVEVTNAKVGDEWQYSGTVYKNVIGIWNIPDTMSAGDNISFRIDLSSNRESCQAVIPCPAVVGGDYQRKSYCGRDFQRTD